MSQPTRPGPAASPSSTPTTITAPSLRIRTTTDTPTPAPELGRETTSTAGSLPVDPIDTIDPSTHSPADAEPTPVKIGKKTLVEILRNAVQTGSLVIHHRFATLPAERVQAVWVADDNDQSGMADPLAAIAARHGGPTASSADMADLIAAGIGLIAYVFKNVKAMYVIRVQARQDRAAAGRNEDTENG